MLFSCWLLRTIQEFKKEKKNSPAFSYPSRPKYIFPETCFSYTISELKFTICNKYDPAALKIKNDKKLTNFATTKRVIDKNYLITIFFMPPHLFFLMEMFCGNAFCTNRRPFLYHLVCFHFVWGRHLFALPPPTESWQLRRTLWPSRTLTRFCTWLTPGAK